MSVAELVLQVCMSVKHHQRWLSLQVSHERAYAQFWRNLEKKMHMVRHEVSFYDFHPFVPAEFLYDFLKSFRYWPYISFRLYFGVNTTWYVQYHFVCDSELALWAMRHHRSFLFAVTWTLTIIEGTVMFLCNFLVIHPHSGWFIVSRTTYAQLSKDSIQALLVLQTKKTV